MYTAKEATAGDPCYGFVGPSSAKAGWVNITFDNRGVETHVMVLMRLDDGKTFEDAMAAMQAADGPPPSWMKEAGGVSLIDPGTSMTIVQRLAPGKYLMFCWVHGHHEHGMVKELQVEPSVDQGMPPKADTQLTLGDYSFRFEPPLKPGMHTIAVRNVGKQPHEAPFIQLFGNTTVMEYATAFEGGSGPPPGHAVGGVNPIQPGETAYVRLAVMPGRYGLVCFVTDPADGKSHAEKGMHQDFEVV